MEILAGKQRSYKLRSAGRKLRSNFPQPMRPTYGVEYSRYTRHKPLAPTGSRNMTETTKINLPTPTSHTTFVSICSHLAANNINAPTRSSYSTPLNIVICRITPTMSQGRGRRGLWCSRPYVACSAGKGRWHYRKDRLLQNYKGTYGHVGQ